MGRPARPPERYPRGVGRTTTRWQAWLIAVTLTAAPTSVPAVAAAAPAELPEGFAGAREAGDAHAAAGDDEAALAAWRTAYGRAPQGPDGDEAREALMLEIGRAERRLYESSREPEHLRRAAAALREHLAANQRRTAADEAAAAHRAEVERELAEVDEQLAALDGPAEPAPAAPLPVLAPPALPAPPPPPADPVLMDQRRNANALVAAGAAFTAVGGIGLVLLAMPAAIAGGIAEDRADNNPFFASESELRERAERRFRFARITALAGLGSLAVGGVLLGVGLARRARIDRELEAERRRVRASVSPLLSPHATGGSLTVRF